jgi:hypothetical protein
MIIYKVTYLNVISSELVLIRDVAMWPVLTYSRTVLLSGKLMSVKEASHTTDMGHKNGNMTPYMFPSF